MTVIDLDIAENTRLINKAELIKGLFKDLE
jgi:hypothetical protein